MDSPPTRPGDEPCRIPDFFGVDSFNEDAMRRYLPKSSFVAFQRVLREGGDLSLALADIVAAAMKEWATERGATHYCHWFQPLSGRTAEKHDSFISSPGDGRALMEFGGKALIKNEADASSFPSAGLRTTFEARGYTAWDCTSPVFVRASGGNVTLFIPSAFCAYTADAMDKKTPLLRSMQAIDAAARRMLAWFDKHFPEAPPAPARVVPTLGVEQEYFLVDQALAFRRPDLRLVGRTLAGARPPKGQDLKDQYYGPLNPRVGSYMHDVNMQLWRLGIGAKTQHNEVAPGQYELACLFTGANVATDWNQVVMTTLQETAPRHGFVCLLHEKPFAGFNGSGKHCNWSLATDDGRNLLEPGHGGDPFENRVFLAFLLAVLAAVDRYPQALLATAAVAGNDQRLGGSEAPPAILSVYLGDALSPRLERLAEGDGNDGGNGNGAGDGPSGPGTKSGESSRRIQLGVATLPRLPRDDTDRNRTSPFAFTGDKFEFRSPGSSQSVADPAMVLNTIVADVLHDMVDRLEADPCESGEAKLDALLASLAREHKRIVFNGDNYTAEWRGEAARRGLPGAAGAVDSLVAAARSDQAAPFLRRGVLSRTELLFRREIMLGLYRKTYVVEARTLLDIGRRQLLPAGFDYLRRLAETRERIRRSDFDSMAVADLLSRVTGHCDQLAQALDALAEMLADIDDFSVVVATSTSTPPSSDDDAPCDRASRAAGIRDRLGAGMRAVRVAADRLEQLVDAERWPLPTYTEMLFLR